MCCLSVCCSVCSRCFCFLRCGHSSVIGWAKSVSRCANQSKTRTKKSHTIALDMRAYPLHQRVGCGVIFFFFRVFEGVFFLRGAGLFCRVVYLRVGLLNCGGALLRRLFVSSLGSEGCRPVKREVNACKRKAWGGYEPKTP